MYVHREIQYVVLSNVAAITTKRKVGGIYLYHLLMLDVHDVFESILGIGVIFNLQLVGAVSPLLLDTPRLEWDRVAELNVFVCVWQNYNPKQFNK